MRILHWGDNRPDPPAAVWDQIGTVDVVLLPIDGSFHVLSPAQIADVTARLGARIVVPHHYAVWDVTTRASTLLPPDAWVDAQPNRRWVGEGAVRLRTAEVKAECGLVLCFGEHVAFDKTALRGAHPDS